MKALAIGFLMVLCSGCLAYENWQLTKAERMTQEEKALLIRDYRICLQEKANTPEKQKDCAVYNQAMYQVDVKGLK
jgi:hypothetical protein